MVQKRILLWKIRADKAFFGVENTWWEGGNQIRDTDLRLLLEVLAFLRELHQILPSCCFTAPW